MVYGQCIKNIPHVSSRLSEEAWNCNFNEGYRIMQLMYCSTCICCSMGCRGVWHMYASEGVYVIPRAKPEELHNTRGCMHMPYTTYNPCYSTLVP